MRTLAIALSSAAFALSGCVATGNSGDSIALSSQAEAGPLVETLDSAELAALIAAGKVVLIDVRTPKEFESGSIAGALNAPVQSFDASAIPRDTARETILYCRSSGRSKRAADMLAAEWNTKVRHLEGGIIAWNAAGQPTSKP